MAENAILSAPFTFSDNRALLYGIEFLNTEDDIPEWILGPDEHGEEPLCETYILDENNSGEIKLYKYTTSSPEIYLFIVGNGSGKINVTQEFIDGIVTIASNSPMYTEDISELNGYELLNIVDEPAVETNTFTVFNAGEEQTYSFNFEEGMTWAEFIESDYNIDNAFSINEDDLVCYNGWSLIGEPDDEGMDVYSTETVINNFAYDAG